MVRKKSVDDGSVKRREGGGIIEADHGRSLIKAARQPNFRRKSKGGCEREIGPLLDARGEESVGPSHEAPWRLAGPLPRPRHAFPKTLFVVTDPSASPPPLSPNNRRFLSDRADPSHDLSLRHEFLFLALHAFDGKRNTISRPTRRCYLYAGRQLTIKDSRFHETSRLERERERNVAQNAPTFRRLNNNNDSVESQ